MVGVRTELELLLNKISDKAGLKPREVDSSVVVEGKTVKIVLDGGVLRIESTTGELEVSEEEIQEVKFFKKKNHCLLKLKNGMLIILPNEEEFRFFVKLKR